MSNHQSRSSRRLVASPAWAIAVTLFLLAAPAIANEVRIIIKAPGGSIPPGTWAFGLGIRSNPTAGGSTITTIPTGTTDAGTATAVATDITNQMGINATTSGNTLIISKHNQQPGFNFDPLAPGTKIGTAFGGAGGPPIGPLGPWGVTRAFRVWAPAPPPLPPIAIQPQRLFSVQIPIDPPLGIPGIFNGLEINLLDDHDQLLHQQFIEIEDSATQPDLDFALMQAFDQFPNELGGWMTLPLQEGFFFGNSLNQPMTGGAIEVLLHPGSENSQMQLMLESEELSFPRDSYADFNIDNVVDGLDLAIWEDHYGQPDVGFAEGDANFDNIVDGADFLEVQRQFGPVPQSGRLTAPPVPEPNTLLLSLVGTFAIMWRTR